MKAFLMFADRDFDPGQTLPSGVTFRITGRQDGFDPWQYLPWSAPALTQDLELSTLLSAMAGDDEFLLEVARRALLSAVTQDIETIRYRQEILRDCLGNPGIVRDIYALSVEAIDREKKNWGWGWSRDYPSGVLGRAVDVLEMLVGILKRLRDLADANVGRFRSAGFRRLFAMLQTELADSYFAEVAAHLKELRFRNGVLLSASLGKGNKGEDYILRKLGERDRSWLTRVFTPAPPSYTLYIHPRDESGGRALSELRDRGITLVANALAQSTDHIVGFFRMLRTELAFYIGCVNLKESLDRLGEPTCFPAPSTLDRRFSCRQLYDVCLALSRKGSVVGNDVDADGKGLVVVTGANQGGKSTFLRSVGLAQLMMQAGVFVAAASFAASVSNGIFTHYKREEDVTMTSGKLDEELARMSMIVDHLRPGALLLFNESFAATNEREGSEIARQIVTALAERDVRMFFVTHLYEFAHRLFEDADERRLFLRAEREPDGSRTFRLLEGEPLPTSFGGDLYERIFGEEMATTGGGDGQDRAIAAAPA